MKKYLVYGDCYINNCLYEEEISFENITKLVSGKIGDETEKGVVEIIAGEDNFTIKSLHTNDLYVIYNEYCNERNKKQNNGIRKISINGFDIYSKFIVFKKDKKGIIDVTAEDYTFLSNCFKKTWEEDKTKTIEN